METKSPESINLFVQNGSTFLEMKPPPQINPGFAEMQEVFFCGPAVEGCRLLVDDAPLAKGVQADRSGWPWKPRFYAGEVRAELIDKDGRHLASWQLDVSPDETKLGRDRFSEMLTEILEFDPSLVVGQEPARQRLGALGSNQDPLVALARLRSHEVALRRSLKAILREPARALRSRRSLVPLHQIRRADRQTAIAALNQPLLLAAMGRLGNIEAASSVRDLRANVPDVERNFDSPANRCLLAMIHALQRRCFDVSEKIMIRIKGRKERSDTTTPLSHRWPTWDSFLQGMRQDLLTVSRRRPFSEVTRAEITAAGLNVVSAHPVYARFWRLAWEALRTGVEGIEQEELLPMNPTWELYERWCFVELCRNIQVLSPHLEWRLHGSGSLVGKASTRTRVRLQLQPNFAKTSGKEKDGFWSISGNRTPDIVLSWESPEDSGFVVLDAKYRVTCDNVLDGMSSAHIYQDSLRMGTKRPVCSVLLVPASGGAPWLEKAEFVAEHKVGIATLRPGDEPSAWLSSILTSCIPADFRRQA